MKGSSWESCGTGGGVGVGDRGLCASMKGSSWESCGCTRRARLAGSTGLNEGQLLGELRDEPGRPAAPGGDRASMKGSSWESCGPGPDTLLRTRGEPQ